MRPLISTFTLTLTLLIAVSIVAILDRAHADSRSAIVISSDHVVPRELDDTVQQTVARDYSAAWKAMTSALADNNLSGLNDNFTGFAFDKLIQRIKDQQRTGVRTRLVDSGHKVEAVFYSPEGSSVELHDTVTLDTEVLDGDTVIHSERSQKHFYAVMTGAEDRWKVRVFESSKD